VMNESHVNDNIDKRKSFLSEKSLSYSKAKSKKLSQSSQSDKDLSTKKKMDRAKSFKAFENFTGRKVSESEYYEDKAERRLQDFKNSIVMRKDMIMRNDR
jgi:hypothetical protein